MHNCRQTRTQKRTRLKSPELPSLCAHKQRYIRWPVIPLPLLSPVSGLLKRYHVWKYAKQSGHSGKNCNSPGY